MILPPLVFHARPISNEKAAKSVNNCLNTNIYSYSETPACQSPNLYLNVVLFSTLVLI
jgi:hypothetical protein